MSKIEDLKNIELNAVLWVWWHLYTKTKIRTYEDKVYTKFRGFNGPEDNIEFKCFTAISIDSLLAYNNKYYL